MNKVAESPTDQADAELIGRAARGDMRAYERLYRRHVDRVYGLCLRMTRDVSTAEECTQDAFVRAWYKLDQFEGRSRFSTWLHRIAVNAVLDNRRNQNPYAEEADESLRSESADFGHAIDLDEAIRQLPCRARDVFVLHVVYGYTHDEVAAFLGIASGTCKAQLHRARKLLRERLGE